MKIEDATAIMYGMVPKRKSQEKVPVIAHECSNYARNFDRPKRDDAEEDFYCGFERAIELVAERLAYTHGKQLAEQIKQEFLVLGK